MLPSRQEWSKMSFASTLYLCPILDLLLAKIPGELQAELRLGLQEALVNAAKHGNKLDPSKTVAVEFSILEDSYFWIISDEGSGFAPTCECSIHPEEHLPPEESESGRGLCILNQVFDEVNWNSQGTQLMLYKQMRKTKLRPTLVT
ncbi:MAG: anti-sigma regulatory factor [Spirulinaceae cyanobacterium]